MKKLALAMIAASAALFGFTAVASAQGYTPASSVTPPTTIGGGYTVTFTNCFVGELITFTQSQSTPTVVTGTCAASSSITGSVVGLILPQQAARGTARGTFTASPTAPGTYTVTAVGPQSGTQTTTFTVPQQATTTTAAPATTVAPPATTPGGGLPATGSDGIAATTGIAIGLLVVGLGLFVVAQVRRRQPSVV